MTNKTYTSKKMCDYELYNLRNNHGFGYGADLSEVRNENDRFHFVDYNGNLIATAKSLEASLQLSNRLFGWGVDAIIDNKCLVAYDLQYGIYGAGHEFVQSLVRRY